MTKTVLVFGASGTIGQGVVKVSLEKGLYRSHVCSFQSIVIVSLMIMSSKSSQTNFCSHTTGYRVVGVFRSAGSAEKTRAHLGNPPQDKFIAVIGNLSKFLSQ